MYVQGQSCNITKYVRNSHLKWNIGVGDLQDTQGVIIAEEEQGGAWECLSGMG